MKARLTIAALLLTTGCLPAANMAGDGGGAPGGDGGAVPDGGFDPNRVDPDACKVQDCSNVVDAVVIPMLAGNGLALTREADAVLCRRLAIDLTGLVPTPAELTDQCLGKQPKEMVDYFMNKATNAIAVDGTPPYVYLNRRRWAGIFAYNGSQHLRDTFYFYVRELDRLVGQLYGGQVKYDEFTRRALASPAFLQRFGDFYGETRDLVQIAAQAYRIFLGREAQPAEATNFGNLFRAWTSVIMREDETLAAYPDCPYGTVPPENGGSCEHWELGLQGSLCEGIARSACQSTVLGAAEVIPATLPFTGVSALSAADRATIETPGKLMVARPELAEAAVDRALASYLGWWKAGVYVPDFDLPAVRHALAQKFVADGYDMRALDREIVTSVLYTQAATRSQGLNLPLWAFGPTKLMSAINTYDNLAFALGFPRTVHDFRYGNTTNIVDHFANLPGQSNSIYLGILLDSLGNDGGLNSLMARRGLLEDVCSGAGVPADATLDAIIDRGFAGVGRPGTAAERQVLTDTLTAPGGDGCPQLTSCDRATTATALCRSLYASALYTFY